MRFKKNKKYKTGRKRVVGTGLPPKTGPGRAPAFFNNPPPVDWDETVSMGDITTQNFGTYTDIYFNAYSGDWTSLTPIEIEIAGFQMNINGESCLNVSSLQIGSILSSYGFDIEPRLQDDGSIKLVLFQQPESFAASGYIPIINFTGSTNTILKILHPGQLGPVVNTTVVVGAQYCAGCPDQFGADYYYFGITHECTGCITYSNCTPGDTSVCNTGMGPCLTGQNCTDHEYEMYCCYHGCEGGWCNQWYALGNECTPTDDCPGGIYDCAGVCNGNAVISGCDNQCNSTAVNDCSGVCGGNSVLDQCGDCNGSCNTWCGDCGCQDSGGGGCIDASVSCGPCDNCQYDQCQVCGGTCSTTCGDCGCDCQTDDCGVPNGDGCSCLNCPWSGISEGWEGGTNCLPEQCQPPGINICSGFCGGNACTQSNSYCSTNNWDIQCYCKCTNSCNDAGCADCPY